jgi:DNA-binding beta-propeller fold protein YncE
MRLVDPNLFLLYFHLVNGMSIDENGRFYILDRNLSRIIQWIPGTNNGTVIVDGQFFVNSSSGIRDSLNQPRAMFIEYYPMIFWIVDTNNHRIVKYINSSSVQIIGGSYGTQVDQMKYPQGLFIRHDLEAILLYIADSENHRILVWLSNSTSGQIIAGITSSYGSRPDQLWNPTALIVDENQCMFIVDSLNSRILKWPIGQSFGLIIAGNEQSGSLPNQLNSPFAFAFNSYGALIVADTNNNRIQFFNISCGHYSHSFSFSSFSLSRSLVLF